MTAGVITVRAALQVDNYCEGNPGDGKLLLISIGLQHLWACDGAKIVNQGPVTTGTAVIANGVDDNTPVGTWQIQAKETDTPLRGCDANGCWDDRVQYWMPFDGNVGLHDASWQTFPFGASNYRTDGSRGCIQLPRALAAWIYHWAPLGTTVTIGA
jgi:lipoprotein-anchoring transpeptidase ErfK/SrfK